MPSLPPPVQNEEVVNPEDTEPSQPVDARRSTTESTEHESSSDDEEEQQEMDIQPLSVATGSRLNNKII